MEVRRVYNRILGRDKINKTNEMSETSWNKIFCSRREYEYLLHLHIWGWINFEIYQTKEIFKGTVFIWKIWKKISTFSFKNYSEVAVEHFQGFLLCMNLKLLLFLIIT